MVTPIFKVSLKEQLYEFLRKEIHQHRLNPGSYINLERASKELGTSRTPLRDALMQLEMEGFVTIVPRQGIYVNPLTTAEIKDYYEVIGALEHKAIMCCVHKISNEDIEEMALLNKEIKEDITQNNFDLFMVKNSAFHNVFIQATGNATLINILSRLKKRLYDFPKQDKWIKDWIEISILQHDTVVEFLRNGEFLEAANFMENVHWSFPGHEFYLKKFYE